MPVSRIYVEKKPPYDVEAQALCAELRTLLGAEGLRRVRLLCRYDVEDIEPAVYARAKEIVFSEPMADVCYDETFPASSGVSSFSVFPVTSTKVRSFSRPFSCPLSPCSSGRGSMGSAEIK